MAIIRNIDNVLPKSTPANPAQISAVDSLLESSLCRSDAEGGTIEAADPPTPRDLGN
jgi:hypothetical protein